MDVIEKLSDGKFENFKFLLDDVDNIDNIQKLMKIKGIDFNVIDKLSDGKFENFKFLIERAVGIKALAEIKGFNLDVINKLSEGKFENFKFLVNKTNSLKTLIKIEGIDVNTIDKLSEGKFKNLKYLISNANNFKSLLEEGFTFDEVIKCKGQDLNQFREQIEEISEKNNINDIKTLVDNDINKLIDLLSDSSVTNNLSNKKIDLDKISQLSNQDLKKTKFLLSNYTVVKENFLSKNSKLTYEDLKKCKAEDIVALANNKISPEQLKASIAERTTFAAPKSPPPSTVKWTTRIQSQTNQKSNQR